MHHWTCPNLATDKSCVFLDKDSILLHILRVYFLYCLWIELNSIHIHVDLNAEVISYLQLIFIHIFTNLFCQTRLFFQRKISLGLDWFQTVYPHITQTLTRAPSLYRNRNRRPQGDDGRSKEVLIDRRPPITSVDIFLLLFSHFVPFLFLCAAAP